MENNKIKRKTPNTNVETNMLNSKKSPSSEKKVPFASRVIEQKIVGLSYFSVAYIHVVIKKIFPLFYLISENYKKFIFQGYFCQKYLNVTEQHFK